MENYDQRKEALIHRGIENSWIINHLTVTEMTKEILGTMVVDKKDILERIAWLKGQTYISSEKKRKKKKRR